MKEMEVHCQYCMCPKEIWKGGNLKTYQGDECKLFSDFSEIISELADTKKPFNNQKIIDKCQSDFKKEHREIKDIEATINEMIQISVKESYMPKNYKVF